MTSVIKTIPKGYKQTEIGVVPTDWDVQPISYIAKVTTGSKNTQDKIDTGLYPFFVRSQVVERINSYSYNGEAILTAGDGVGTGKVFHYINGKFDIHQRVYKISDFSSDINGYYFYLYFSNNFYKRIMQMTAKSSVDSVRMEMIADMQIPLPSKTEQVSITKALSDISTLIQKTESLIEKKRVIKQGAMQELLTGKRRLSGFSGDWDYKRLGDITDMSSGGTPLSSNPVYYGGWIPWVVIADMTRITKYLFDTEKKITNKGLENSSAKLFPAGTLLFAMYASIGKCSITKVDVSCNQAILGINTKKIDIEFLYYYLSFNEQKFLQMGQSGTQNNLNKEIVENFSIPYPQIPEQTAIATILSDMDTEIEKLESEMIKWKDIKQGMVQTLLTGKIRLI